MAQNWHDLRYNKNTKQLLVIKVWSLLLVRPWARDIRLLFRNGVTLWNSAPLKALSLWIRHWWPSHFPSKFFFNRCSSKAKVKTGRQVIRQVECFKNPSLTFCNGPTSMTTRLELHNIIWHPCATSEVFKHLITITSINCLYLLSLRRRWQARINDTMLIPVVPAALRRIFFLACHALNQVEMQLCNCGPSCARVGVIVTSCDWGRRTVRALGVNTYGAYGRYLQVFHHSKVRETTIMPLPIPMIFRHECYLGWRSSVQWNERLS